MPPRPDEARREQLLDQIQGIFLAEGFLQSRVGVLADRLHCSRSTLYKLAPSKEDLFVLIVDRYADAAVHEAMREAEAQCSPIEKVAVLLETVANWQRMGSAAFWTDAMEFEGTADRFSPRSVHGGSECFAATSTRASPTAHSDQPIPHSSRTSFGWECSRPAIPACSTGSDSTRKAPFERSVT